LDDRYSVAEAKILRQRRILATYREAKPSVVLVELFPFGRKKFADEIIPLIGAANASPDAPLVVCSLRDILVGSRRDQQQHDDRAATLANRYFDAVPVHYTGFVLPEPAEPGPEFRREGILVSAGGGMVGAPLMYAAADAQRILWKRSRRLVTLVAGPLLPESDWQVLTARTLGQEGLTLCRSLPELARRFEEVSASVSQCGYNTAMELIAGRVPALVVPFAAGREDEQMNRARRLAGLGLLRVLDPRELSADRLAAEIEGLETFRPNRAGLKTDGAACTSSLLMELHAKRVRTRLGRSIMA
jgi:predicted glycosyltransferase